MNEQPAFKNGNASGPNGGGGQNGQNGGGFASLTAGIMARKGEASPAPAHLDGVSLHTHGVARQPDVPRPPVYHEPDPEPVLAPVGPVEPVAQVEEPEREPVEAREGPPEPALEPVMEPELKEDEKPFSTPELRKKAHRKATLSSGDCCELPLPTAVTQTLPQGAKARVITRLDPERVRKLKILAARMGTSNQKVMLAALDHYLEYACEVMAAECPCLARSMANKD